MCLPRWFDCHWMRWSFFLFILFSLFVLSLFVCLCCAFFMSFMKFHKQIKKALFESKRLADNNRVELVCVEGKKKREYDWVVNGCALVLCWNWKKKTTTYAFMDCECCEDSFKTLVDITSVYEVLLFFCIRFYCYSDYDIVSAFIDFNFHFLRPPNNFYDIHLFSPSVWVCIFFCCCSISVHVYVWKSGHSCMRQAEHNAPLGMTWAFFAKIPIAIALSTVWMRWHK